MTTSHESKPVESQSRWYRPSILHCMYAMALLGASIAAFDLYGLIPGGLLLIGWAYVYSHRSRPTGLRNATSLLIALVFLAFFTRAIWLIEEPPYIHMQCQNNLKQITMSLHNYHDTYGSFPPAYTTDSEGRPMHSWRLLIAPFTGRPWRMGNYYPFDMSQPWDSPQNLKLAQDYQPEFYDCPHHPATKHSHTSYFAVVGPGTAWQQDRAMRLEDIADGTEFTLLLIEDPTRDVLWTEPTDIGYEEAIKLLSAQDRRGPHPDAPARYMNTWSSAGFADARSHMIRQGAAPDDLASVMLIDDGTAKSQAALERVCELKERSLYDIVARGGAFLFVVLWPICWVWRYL